MDTGNNNFGEDRSNSITMAREFPAPFGIIHLPFFPSSETDSREGTETVISWMRQGDVTPNCEGEDYNLPAVFIDFAAATEAAAGCYASNIVPPNVYAIPAWCKPPQGVREHYSHTPEHNHGWEDLPILVFVQVKPAQDIPQE